MLVNKGLTNTMNYSGHIFQSGAKLFLNLISWYNPTHSFKISSFNYLVCSTWQIQTHVQAFPSKLSTFSPQNHNIPPVSQHRTRLPTFLATEMVSCDAASAPASVGSPGWNNPDHFLQFSCLGDLLLHSCLAKPSQSILLIYQGKLEIILENKYLQYKYLQGVPKKWWFGKVLSFWPWEGCF